MYIVKIAIIGAGAMGSIYGAYLSKRHEVFLIDKNEIIVDHINQRGLTLQEEGKDTVYHPQAFITSQGLGKMDLVILFVKALYSKAALTENREIMDENTCLMTLQNGSGHEDILQEAAPLKRIVIGTTEDNGCVLSPGNVRHGGTGRTNIGMLTTDGQEILLKLKEAFDSCGFDTRIHDNIQQLIWDKLFTNISLSAVTGILQVPMGFIAADHYAWEMTRQLLHEAVGVAQQMGLFFNEQEILKRIRKTSEDNPQGETSIYSDLKNGRLTEVDTISGSVVRAAAKQKLAVPAHQFLVNMVHAMEVRNKK